METVIAKGGILSNYEVLTILRRQKVDRQQKIEQIQRQARLNKNFVQNAAIERVQPTDLHTVTFEAIKYLEEPVHPLRRLDEDSISRLTTELASFGLTQSEVLMLINHAPTTLVELQVHIEAFELRFSDVDTQNKLLETIKSCLSDKESAATITKRSRKESSSAAAGSGKMDVDEQDEQEEGFDEGMAEENELVQEGLSGGVDAAHREIDEVDE